MRVVDLATGFTAASAPGTSGVLPTITGSTGSPSNVTAGAGVSPSGDVAEIIFVDGTGGVDITASPQIAVGTTIGTNLILVGTSDVNSVLLEDGDGLSLNGDMLLQQNSTISLIWDGTVWSEESRK